MIELPLVRVVMYRQRPEEFRAKGPAPFDNGALLVVPSGDGWWAATFARTTVGDKVVAAITDRDLRDMDERRIWVDRVAYAFADAESPRMRGSQMRQVLSEDDGVSKFEAQVHMRERRRLVYNDAVEAAMLASEQVPD